MSGRDWREATCPECGAGMEQKPGTEFGICPNCKYDTEELYDKAVMRGFEIGRDLIKEIEE